MSKYLHVVMAENEFMHPLVCLLLKGDLKPRDLEPIFDAVKEAQLKYGCDPANGFEEWYYIERYKMTFTEEGTIEVTP